MPEIEELRQALESGDVSELLSDKEEQVMISSSLVTIPTYIKDPAKLPPDVLAMMINNKQTYDFLLQNFPDALKDIHSAENLQKNKKNQENAVDSKSPNKADTESKSVKLKRRVSSLIKGQNQKSILKNEESKYINESEIVQSPGSGQSKWNQGRVGDG